ncbi:enoyl-CoA hydratase/isomerase family protein [Brevibacterium atlanticum]|uniref:enoyl-CoA hydratase/isomerase family protein n=1 Tax=Brevibacterium atlanticum TaxID=2697563 RepID=UPI001D1833E4|nr:enoyl-CoA hydratase-related protein [Brevibacterium atlanticum]
MNTVTEETNTAGEQVLYEVIDRTAWITINRPQARNALNAAVREGLRECFLAAEGDDEVAVIVLTGAGQKAFCAGGDLKEMADASLTIPPPDYVPQPNRTLDISKPIIAAVNGLALAGGFLLAQSADLIVAAENAKFGVTEIKIGRGAPWAAPLAWLIPPRIAMEMLVTGDPLAADRAYEVGLVNDVVPAERLQERVAELAATIAANAPLSVRAGKATVYATAHHTRDEAFDAAEDIWRDVYLSEDAQEGLQAFVEKRKPMWQAR